MQGRFARPLKILVAPILLATALAVGVAFAQAGDDESAFTRFLEGMLSTPERTVSLSGLEGAFSWHPTVRKMTVADRAGVWLELNGVEVAWTRSALLRRVLDIQVLRAARVHVLRRPVPSEAAPTSGGLSGPPLEMNIDTIALPKIVLDAPVAGVAADLTASGSTYLSAESMTLHLEVDRQDRAGSLTADIRFEPANNVLAADLKFAEPGDGLLVELLKLRGRPAVAVILSGTGPLDKWQASLDVQADGRRVVSGAMSITRTGPALQVIAKAAAALGTLVPEDYAALLAGESRLDLDLLRSDDGAIAVRAATLKSEGVDLSASGALAADMVPQRANISLQLGQAGRAMLLGVPGDVSVASFRANATLNAGDPAPWRIDAAAEGAEGDFGKIADLAVNVAGQAQNLLDADARATSFRVQGKAQGVALADAGLGRAVGSSLALIGDGSWTAGQPLAVENLQLTLPGASATIAGKATREEFEGTLAAAVGDLSRFATLAGRRLSGGIDFQASGSATMAGAFDLKLDGTATDLALGMAALDSVLSGTMRIEGGVARQDAIFTFDGLKLSNERATAEVSGSLGDPTLDLSVSANVADLKLLTPRAAGAAGITAKLSGSRAVPKVEAEVSGENVVLMGRSLEDATARFSGVVAGPQTSGEAEIAGALGGAAISGSAKLAAGEGGTRTLENLVLAVGDSKISGGLVIGADGLLAGDLAVVSPDLSKVAPLFLTKASGTLRADVKLATTGGAQAAAFSGTATDIVYETVALQSADISGDVRDAFRVPQIEGKFSLRNLTAGGLAILTATGTASRQGDATALSVDARLADGRATVIGSLAPGNRGMAIALQKFAYARPGIDVALASPTTLAVQNGIVRFDRTTLKASGGTVTLSGQAGSTLDLSATLKSVPVALANSFVPNLGAEGTVSGTVTAKGSASAPAASFDVAVAGGSVAASRNAGLGALGVSAKGSLANKVVNLSTRISGADGLAMDVAGTIGTAAGAPVNLRVKGSAPLSLGNRQLASRGAALKGALAIDIGVTGTASTPKFSGRVTSSGGGFVDPDTGIVLKNVVLAATVSNDRVVVEQLAAESGEGNVSALGSIGLDPGAGFPIDLSVQVRKARYVDGALVAARFDADLKLAGTLSDGPLLDGSVFLDRTEITVPERLPRDSVAVDVKHVDAPRPVEETLAVVRERDTGGEGGRKSAGIRLSVAINAPRQIFVRGRGLDTELGGSLRLTGSMSALSASGAFQMVRGRLDILTQRIVFDRGVITFAGDLDPIIEFSGSTRSGDTTITVTVSGRASDPEVVFSSVPELPQDEILARLIFNKGIGELSPLQVARLAAAVSELSGGSGGILSRLRATTGLDDLDIVTDEEGQTSVAAGRYISENVYVGVQQGATAGSSRVTIDLDVTKDIKARAGMSAEEGSSLGIFFEREY